jgi:hypothetical protein
MKVKYSDSIECKIQERFDAIAGEVVLREDLTVLGSYRQISRALNRLIQKQQLIKIGFGLYAKAKPSHYIDDAILREPLATVATQALDRLGVKWELGQALQDYNAGRSQQVPIKFIVRLKSRLRRELAVGMRQITFEGGINTC